MKKNEKLLINTVLFAINALGSRIIVFLLIPLYAHYMSAGSYGIADLVYSTVSLLLTVFSLKVSAAILRFANPKRNDNQIVLANSAIVIIISFAVVLLLTIIAVPALRLSVIYYYMPIVYLFGGFKDITAQYCKATGKTKIYAADGAISSFSLLIFNLLFLVFLKMEANGYLISVILSYSISLIYLIHFGKIKYYIEGVSVKNPILMEMLSYSLPLVPNSFSWWIIQMSDRYMVAWFISQSANGIYTMSYKIPSMMGVVSDIFMQAWVLSAISEYDGEKDYRYFKTIYASFEGLLFVASSMIICLTRPLAVILFGSEFLDAGKYSPLLIFALLFSNLQAFFGCFYNAAKRTKELLYSSILAALVNIILNVFLIRSIGIYGAVISTCISYALLSFLRIIGSRKYVLFDIDFSIMGMNIFLLFGQSINETINSNNYLRNFINILLMIALIVLNINRVRSIIERTFSMIKEFCIKKIHNF